MFVIRFLILYVSYLGFAFLLLARHSPEQARSPPSLLLNENVLCLVVVWVDSLQPEGAFMSLTAKLHKILE